MNSTNTTGWMPEPIQRGTIGLVESCLLTLWLCVYTALHLNLPLHAEPAWKGYVRKTLWILIGVVAPEIVAYTALMQYISARKLTKIVNSQLEYHQPERRFKWTLKHSFFASMGGFAIETEDLDKPVYIPGSPRLTVTANGLALIAQAGHLPDVSIESIEDKSTQNSLGKTFATLQGSWFLLHITARLVEGLPLSLLEIHTAAHVLCALLIYFLWWEKPYDVSEALVLTGPWVRPLSAALWMFSYNNTSKERFRSIGKTHSRLRPPEIEGLIHFELGFAEHLQPLVPTLAPTVHEPILTEVQSHSTVPTPPARQNLREILQNVDAMNETNGRSAGQFRPLRLLHVGTLAVRTLELPDLESIRDGEVLLPYGFGPNTDSKTFEKILVRGDRPWKPLHKGYRDAVIPLNQTLVERWTLACEAFDSFPALWAPFKRGKNRSSSTDNPSWITSEYPPEWCQLSYLNPRIPDWPWKDLIDGGSSVLPISLLAICASLYGGIHASAWAHFFPTPTERVLWRCSSILLASTGLWWTLSRLAKPCLEYLEKLPDQVQWVNIINIALMILGWLTSIIVGMYLVCLYAAARAYLPIEALASLRDLPVAVYQEPKWTKVVQAIPHL